MRTCDAVGAKLVLIGYTPKPEGKTLKMVAKTAIGAESTVSWKHYDSAQEVLNEQADAEHVAIEISYTSEDIIEYLGQQQGLDLSNVFLWFGNEISGLEPDLVSQMSKELHLPMLGMKESINVASCVCATSYLFLSKSK